MSNLQDGNAAKRVYTVEEISEILGISRSAAYELVKKDEFKSVRIGATIRISKSSLTHGWTAEKSNHVEESQ